jgi:hypothetical protein
VRTVEKLTAGWSRTQLAQRRFISKNTVMFRIRSLYRKLDQLQRIKSLYQSWFGFRQRLRPHEIRQGAVRSEPSGR